MVYKLVEIYAERWQFFLELTIQHICISSIAIALAIFLGVFLGVLTTEYKRAAPYILGFVNTTYTIPSISLLGFLIPFTGVGDTTAIIALTVYALLPMVRNTYTGIEGIEPAVIEAAEGMGSTRIQMLFRIKLPLALLVILSGLRSTVIMTIALAGIASFIGAGGLGVAIYRGITTNNAAMTLAGSLLIAILALVVDGLLGLVERGIKKKRRLTV